MSLCNVMHYSPLVGIRNYSRKHRHWVGPLDVVSSHRGLAIARASCHRLDTSDVPVLVVSFGRQYREPEERRR